VVFVSGFHVKVCDMHGAFVFSEKFPSVLPVLFNVRFIFQIHTERQVSMENSRNI